MSISISSRIRIRIRISSCICLCICICICICISISISINFTGADGRDDAGLRRVQRPQRLLLRGRRVQRELALGAAIHMLKHDIIVQMTTIYYIYI